MDLRRNFKKKTGLNADKHAREVAQTLLTELADQQPSSQSYTVLQDNFEAYIRRVSEIATGFFESNWIFRDLVKGSGAFADALDGRNGSEALQMYMRSWLVGEMYLDHGSRIREELPADLSENRSLPMDPCDIPERIRPKF